MIEVSLNEPHVAALSVSLPTVPRIGEKIDM